jgi:predicted helicase
MTPIEQVLADIRAVAKDEQDKGRRFERLMLHAFQTDRTFRQQFSEVWTWLDWPDRRGADIGVDLVARNLDGSLTAIQCKCYAPTATLTKEEIDSFVAMSGQKQWSRRIIVATTDLWSANAEKSLEGHAVPIERIGIDDLDAMTVDWSSYDVTNPAGVAPTPRYVLREHQIKAVEAVRLGFKEASRGKLIMACGTGKTFTALRIAEEHAGAGKSVLFLAPSIALVAQSLKEWRLPPLRRGPWRALSSPHGGRPGVPGVERTSREHPARSPLRGFLHVKETKPRAAVAAHCHGGSDALLPRTDVAVHDHLLFRPDGRTRRSASAAR